MRGTLSYYSNVIASCNDALEHKYTRNLCNMATLIARGELAIQIKQRIAKVTRFNIGTFGENAMRYLWFGAFVLSTICIGIYFSRDRTPPTEKGNVNVIGPYRYCANTRCTEHQRLHKTARLACMCCRHPLVEPSLEDLEWMKLPEEEAANLDLAARYFSLMQRCNKYHLEQSDALAMLALEKKYCSVLFMEDGEWIALHKSMNTQEQDLFSERATIETLPIAEFNVFLCNERTKWGALPVEDR